MTDRHFEDPQDEPVIGGPPHPYRPPREADEPIIGADYPPARYAAPAPAADHWDVDDSDGSGAYDEPVIGYGHGGYADDGYHDDRAARRPLVYVLIGVGVLALLGLAALLFALLPGGGDDSRTEFRVSIDSPRASERVEVGKPLEVVVQATSREAVSRFELFADDRRVDTVDVASSNPGGIERATLRTTFTQRGEHTIFVRAAAASGATKDSPPVTVVATEPVGEVPSSIKGKVVAAVNVRTGPGENFDTVGSLAAGDEVTIRGKTANREWLLVDSPVGANLWVKASAIQASDSLVLVPVKEPTTTPRPSPSPSPSAEATPRPSPTPSDTNGSRPDFIPASAALIDGGSKLRVTISNAGTIDYSGALVVSAGGVGPGTETQAFNVSIAAKATATVEFALNPPVTVQKVARIQVDVGDAVKESAEDNNSATFTVTPPVESPNLVIGQVTISAGQVQVQVRNTGGALPVSNVVVKITVGEAAAEQSKSVALVKDQSETFTVANPPKGTGTVAVLVNGTVVASQAITVPQ